MKTSLRVAVLLVVVLGVSAVCPPARAQTIPLQDQNARLMQEYMVRRAEWLALRSAVLDKVKAAKTDHDKKQELDKLAEDEKPLLAKMGEAARAYKAAEKAKRDAMATGKPHD